MRGLIAGLVGVVLAFACAGQIRAAVSVLDTQTNPANNHTYFLLSQSAWAEAETKAVELGGHLVTINDVPENTFVLNKFGQTAAAQAPGKWVSLWTGLNDVQQERVFKWSSGDQATYRNWAPGQPEGRYDDEDYVGMFVNWQGANYQPGKWHDILSDGRGGDVVYGVAEISSPPPPPQSRIDPPTVPSAPSGTKGLIYLVHGWNSNPSGWATTMKTNIENQLKAIGQDGNWKVEAADWSQFADPAILEVVPNDPWLLAPIFAGACGTGIGQEIKDAGYTAVHFVAHSDGAWLINSATAKIKQLDSTIKIQNTFLDPNTALNGTMSLGKTADFAESYFSNKDLIGTNSPLKQAHNVDVTDVADITAVQAAVPGASNSVWPIWDPPGHKWPYQWYDQTVKDYDPVNKAGWAYGYGNGFPLSMEMNDGDLPSYSAYPRGDTTVLPPDTLPSYTSLSTIRTDPVVDFQNSTIYQSDTGTKTVNGTNLTMTTGSPVWVTSLVSVTQPVNLLEFQADFTSAMGAEGLLAVYWAGQPIGTIDERFALEGMQDYMFVLPDTPSAGTYALSFRLDPYTNTPSSVLIDNVATGFATVPEPSTLALLSVGAAVTLASAWRRGALVNADHKRRTARRRPSPRRDTEGNRPLFDATPSAAQPPCAPAKFTSSRFRPANWNSTQSPTRTPARGAGSPAGSCIENHYSSLASEFNG